MTRQIIGAQGEVSIFRVDALPSDVKPHTEVDRLKRPIISHSESGHHHVLDAPGVQVMERTKDVPAGMRVLYAILENPTALIQDAKDAHGSHDLAPGIYEFRLAREYDPFAEQARQVAD